MNKQLLTVVFVGLGSVTVGYLAGFLITKKRIQERLEHEYQDALEETRTRLIQRSKAEGYSTPGEAGETLGVDFAGLESEVLTDMANNIIEEEGYLEPVDGVMGHLTKEALAYYADEKKKAEERSAARTKSIWTAAEVDEVEVEVLDKTKPYVISAEEFQMDDPKVEKTSITYYDGDDTLVDERDQMIPDIDRVVGEHNLIRFGDRSDDPNVVYVRNEMLDTDFEIFRDLRSFTEVILGVTLPDDDEEHPRNRKKPKLRDDV